MTNTQTDKAIRFLELHKRGDAAADAQRMGSRLRRDARLARVPGARDHEQRARGDARAARRGSQPRRGARPCRRARRRHRPPGVGRPRERRSPTIPPASPRRSAWRSRPVWPGARWRTTPAGEDARIYDLDLARERVAAAVEVAHAGPVKLVLTARAENHIRGRDDLADTIARLVCLSGGRRRRAVRARADEPRGHPPGRRVRRRGR